MATNTEIAPNGLTSYSETFYLLMDNLVEQMNKGHKGIERIREGGGVFALSSTLQMWTLEFENANKDRDWAESDVDFIDAVDMFFHQKISAL